MKAKFTIEYRTEWGESLFLVAGGKKYPMTWGEGGLWSVEIDPCPKALLQKYGYEVVRDGLTLWDISQMFGVQLKKLMLYNGFPADMVLEEGDTVILRKL